MSNRSLFGMALGCILIQISQNVNEILPFVMSGSVLLLCSAVQGYREIKKT